MPRRLALHILKRVERDRAYANILLRERLSASHLSRPDRALVTELVYGTLRWRGKIDYILSRHSKLPIKRLSRDILNILRLGAYQLLWLQRVPPFAIIDEAVEMAKEKGGQGAGRFINGVLRAIQRDGGQVDPPDINYDPVGHISALYSQPDWLIRSWIEQYGLDRAIEFAKAFNERPPLTLRVNRLKVSRDELLKELKARPCAFSPEGIRVSGLTELEGLDPFRRGLFSIQDEGAQLVSHLLAPEPGERVLDACAAPGGKATHMASLMNNKGMIIALDVNHARLRLVASEAERLGIDIIKPLLADATKLLPFKPPGRGPGFHKVLIDAPCTGSGVIRRHPEGKWHQPNIPSLVALQKTLLLNLSRYLKVGGILVYSVCSTDRREGEEVMEAFLKEENRFRLDPNLPNFMKGAVETIEAGAYRTWPTMGGMDAFYMARLKRVK